MAKVTVDDGVVISYDLYDFTDPWSEESQVILLNHGSAENRKFFTPIIPALARKYSVVSYDARARGESTLPGEMSTLSGEPEDGMTGGARLAKDALCLINELGIEKIHWFGTASGFAVGVIFATSYPDRIKSLIGCGGVPVLPKWLVEAFRCGRESIASAIEELGARAWWKKIWDLGRGNSTGPLDLSKADPRMAEWELAERMKVSTHGYAVFHKLAEHYDVSGLYSKIRVPTLLLTGEKSIITPLEQQRLMEQQIPKAKLIVFQDLGQSVHMLAPDRVSDAVLDFLQTVD